MRNSVKKVGGQVFEDGAKDVRGREKESFCTFSQG